MGANGQLAFTPGLVEEDHPQGVRAIFHLEGDHGFAILHASRAAFGHFAEDGRFITDAQITQVNLLGAVNVAAGIPGQQVKDIEDANLSEGGRSLDPDVAQSIHRHLRQGGERAKRLFHGNSLRTYAPMSGAHELLALFNPDPTQNLWKGLVRGGVVRSCNGTKDCDDQDANAHPAQNNSSDCKTCTLFSGLFNLTP